MSPRLAPLPLALAAALAAAAPARGGAEVPVSLTAEVALSLAESHGLASSAGPRVSLRLGPLLLGAELALASAVGDPIQPDLAWLFLVGPGIAMDVGTRLSVHASAVAGSMRFRVRDVYDEGWVEDALPTAGLRVGTTYLTSLPPRRADGGGPIAPVLGLSATVLFARTSDDPFRGIRIGGPTFLVSLTVGAGVFRPTWEREERGPR